MVGTEGGFVDRQGPAHQRLRLRNSVGDFKQLGQVVEADGDVGMVGADPQPLFVLTEADKEKTGYNDLRSLFSDHGQGHMTLQDGVLYYLFKDRMVAYDTVNNRLEHYSVPVPIEGYGRVTQDKVITRSSSQVSVKYVQSALQRFETSRPALLLSVDVNTFKKPI